MDKSCLGMAPRAALVAFLLLMGLAPISALADDACAPAKLTLSSVTPAEVGLGQKLTVKIAGLAETKCDLSALRLRLDGHTLANLPELDDLQEQQVTYKLERTDADRAGWQDILGSPPTSGVKTVAVSVEWTDKTEMRYAGATMPTVRLVIFTAPQMLFTVFVAVALGVAIFVQGSQTSLLRDFAPSITDPLQRTFSLGRCQMAFWLVLLTVGFVVIWSITGDYQGILTPQSLVLLGISGATALSATSIDASKATAAAATAAAAPPPPANPPPADPNAPTPPRHVSFLDDILTDVNGPALQRLQVLVWTLLLGLISVVSMYRTLSLPAFDDTLLALAGISSGLYVGFKWPEKQS